MSYTVVRMGYSEAFPTLLVDAVRIARNLANRAVFGGPVEIRDSEGFLVDTILPEISEVQFQFDEIHTDGRLRVSGSLDVNGYSVCEAVAIATSRSWVLGGVLTAYLDDSTKAEIERMLALDLEKSLLIELRGEVG